MNDQPETMRIQPAELPEDQRRRLTGHRLVDAFFPAAVVVVLTAIVRCFVWLDADRLALAGGSRAAGFSHDKALALLSVLLRGES